MNFTTLISAADLAAHLENRTLIVCDCRHDLVDTDAGRRAYARSHIPGARFVHLDEHLSGRKTGTNGRHPLPDSDTFASTLGALGIDNTKQVVAYDASGGYYAARLWWMMRWVGHRRAAVLDGGWQAWLEAELRADARPVVIEPTRFIPIPQANLAVDVQFVASHLTSPDMCLIDARSADRFRGENETLDPVGGHIPGALNRPFRANLDSSGLFKPSEELKREFIDMLGSRSPHSIVHQCGSGVTACHNLLAMEVAGLTGSRLYAGSWSEWLSHPARPTAR